MQTPRQMEAYSCKIHRWKVDRLAQMSDRQIKTRQLESRQMKVRQYIFQTNERQANGINTIKPRKL